ncbi:MAG TPA: DUF6493 family protein [Polyangiaceae bacterium]|nr:DUF6493 family protein [Polyangiaceae bacterium]
MTRSSRVGSEFQGLLEAGNVESALDWIAAADSASREAALDVAIECCKRWCVGDWVTEGATSNYEWQGTEEQRTAAKLSVLALGNAETISKRLSSAKSLPINYHTEAFAVLDRFRPAWLASGGVDLLIDAGRFSLDLVMALRESTLCPQPKCEQYIIRLIGAPRRWYGGKKTFLDVLDEHPRVRKEDIRLIFTIEGNSEFNLAALDKYGGGSGGWNHILLTLLERGEFSRDELLDTTLEVLSRGYPAFRAGWYSRFHEQLEPSIEERVARQADYERLLGSTVPQTVSFALKSLELVQKQGALEPLSFLEAVEPALSAPQAEVVKRALKMLDVLHKSAPNERERCAGLALLALSHERADVQDAGLELFHKAGGAEHPDLAQRLRAMSADLAPSVKQKLERAEPKSKSKPSKEAAAKSVSATSVAGAPLWHRPDPFAAECELATPATLEAALDCMSRAIEHSGDAESFECALAAASLFGAATTGDLQRLAGPLKKRAAQLLTRGPRDALQFELVRVALAWTAREKNRHPHVDLEGLHAVDHFILRRTDALIDRLVRAEGEPLLSTPSHRHGWLTERALLARLEARTVSVDPEDAVLALLRLPQEAAARSISRVAQRVATSARGALESAATECAVGRVQPYVFRWGDQYVWHRVRLTVDPAAVTSNAAVFPELLLHALAGEKGAFGFDSWLPLALPRSNEWVAAAEALRHGGYRFDESGVNGELYCWNDPSIEPGPNAYYALAVALGARSTTIALSACDVLIAAIACHRLRPEQLGASFATLLPSGLIKPGRWTEQLSKVAAVSATHAEAVWRAILAGLRGDPAAFPRDMGKLLGLAKELQIAAAQSCQDPQARAWLSTLKGSSQLAKNAALLLA